MRHGEIVSREGVLAQWFGATYNPELPGVRIESWVLTRVLAAEWPEAVGQVPWAPGGSLTCGTVRVDYAGEAIWDVRHLPITRVEVPEPAPRAGGTYTWRWDPYATHRNGGGPWVKAFYSPCRTCGRRHDPDWSDCPKCGQCHRPGRKCSA